MKKLIKLILILSVFIVFSGTILIAVEEFQAINNIEFRLKEKGVSTEDLQKIISQLKLALKEKLQSDMDIKLLVETLLNCLKERLTPEDSVKISLKVKDMSRETSPQHKRQMKIMLKEELAEGIEIENISNSLEVLNEAVKEGYSPSEMRLKIVSAVQNAKLEGKRGNELREEINKIRNLLKETKHKDRKKKIHEKEIENIIDQKEQEKNRDIDRLYNKNILIEKRKKDDKGIDKKHIHTEKDKKSDDKNIDKHNEK